MVTVDRRSAPRLIPPPDLPCTIRPGLTTAIVNLSASGVLVQMTRALRPGGLAWLCVGDGARRTSAQATILRCRVVSLRPGVVIYEAALRFHGEPSGTQAGAILAACAAAGSEDPDRSRSTDPARVQRSRGTWQELRR